MTPIKLFPHIISDPLGVPARNSAILHYMGPIKEHGPRTYIDPAFLTELGLRRIDPVWQRYLGSTHPTHPSNVVVDEHTLMPLALYLESTTPTSTPAFCQHYLYQEESHTTTTYQCTAPTILWGSGTLSFAQQHGWELSHHTPTVLPAHTVFEVPGYTLLTILSTQPLHTSHHTPSPLPDHFHPLALSEPLPTTPLPLDSCPGALHYLPAPQELLVSHHPHLLVQLQGCCEIHHNHLPVDILYTGEERLLLPHPTPYLLHPLPDTLPIVLTLQ